MRGRPNLWYLTALWLVRIPFALLTRRRQRGKEHLQQSGGVIVAANHVSHLDAFPLGLFVHSSGRIARFMAKVELFRLPVVGRIIRNGYQIPVYRNTPNAKDALRDGIAAVKAGQCVIIYPEGTITKDPDRWPMRARPGVARLALETGAPVVPVASWGPNLIRKRRIPFRVPVDVWAGPPVDLSKWQGVEPTEEVLRAVTDEIMATLTRMVEELRGEQAPAEVYDPRARHLRAVPDERRTA